MSHGRLQHILFKARLSIDKKSIYLFQFFLPDIFAQPFLFFSFFFFSFCGFVNISQQLFSSSSSSSSSTQPSTSLGKPKIRYLRFAFSFPFLSFPFLSFPFHVFSSPISGGAQNTYKAQRTVVSACRPMYGVRVKYLPCYLPYLALTQPVPTYLAQVLILGTLGTYFRLIKSDKGLGLASKGYFFPFFFLILSYWGKCSFGGGGNKR